MNTSRNRFLHQIYPLFCLAFGLIFASPAISANQANEKNIDATVKRAMEVFQVPGMAMKAVSPETDFSYDFHDLDLRYVKEQEE